jgi:dGTPase
MTELQAGRGYGAADRQRWLAEDPARKRADRDDFARDRGRVLHSASLRRLAAKTQVLTAGHDDFVRNRLTHSLEVAQIGREFGEGLGCNADVVEVACLAHDLGHPPFGHTGESALDLVAADIGGFEGNAQSLRLLTRLEAKRHHPDGRSAGLNLTRACLDAVAKYPWARGEAPYVTGKYGAYADDLPVFTWVREGAPTAVRCLEAQVMDWSDDVAYSVHDVEDAVAAGLVDVGVLTSRTDMADALVVARSSYAPDLPAAELEAALDRIIASGLLPTRYDGTRTDQSALKDMTSQLIGRLVGAVEEATRQRYGHGPLARYDAELVVPASARAECAVLKGAAAHFVMHADARLALHADQRDVVADLVTAYLADPAGRLDPDLWVDYATASGDAARLRVVVDQVASLTDPRATALHRRWCE